MLFSSDFSFSYVSCLILLNTSFLIRSVSTYKAGIQPLDVITPTPAPTPAPTPPPPPTPAPTPTPTIIKAPFYNRFKYIYILFYIQLSHKHHYINIH